MKTIHPKSTSLSQWISRSPAVDNVCRKILFSKLKQFEEGRLIIDDQSGDSMVTYEFGNPAGELQVRVTVNRTSFYSRTLLGGSIGNAESYIDGDWQTDDLTTLIRVFVRTRHLL